MRSLKRFARRPWAALPISPPDNTLKLGDLTGITAIADRLSEGQQIGQVVVLDSLSGTLVLARANGRWRLARLHYQLWLAVKALQETLGRHPSKLIRLTILRRACSGGRIPEASAA